MGGGRWWRAGDVHHADFPNAILQIEQALVVRRAYVVSTSIAASMSLHHSSVPEDKEVRDYQNARAYATHFNNIFVESPNSPGKVTNREFATFFNVLRCFDEDSDRITNDGSSAMKVNNLVVYFI